MQEKNLSRRAKERLRHRHQILEAALELFTENGYYSVTMHEIAAKSEFAIGTLYKFFRNKEDLYKALMLEKAEQFHEIIHEAIGESEDEMEKLRNFVSVKGEIIRSHASLIRLYFTETHGESFKVKAGLDSELRKGHDEILKALASVFAEGIEKGRFKEIADPYFLAIALDGITSAFLCRWLESPECYLYPEDPNVILNIFFNGLIQR